jgi:RNA polymerase sigma-70 factor (ECF subfamily)
MGQRIPPEAVREISELFVQESAAVFRAAFNATRRNRSESEDAVQEAFQAAALSWNSTVRDLSPAQKRAWLCRVAIFKVIDSYRAAKLLELTEDQSDEIGSPSAEHIALRRVASQHCLEAIGGMPVVQRTVAYLKFFEEWSTNEIGKFLGISASTVRVHVHSARVTLEKAVGPEVLLTSEEADGERAL